MILPVAQWVRRNPRSLELEISLHDIVYTAVLTPSRRRGWYGSKVQSYDCTYDCMHAGCQYDCIGIIKAYGRLLVQGQFAYCKPLFTTCNAHR